MPTAAPSTNEPRLLLRARLPRWWLPVDWPTAAARPALADIAIEAGRIALVRPSASPVPPGAIDLDGAPVLPGLVDAHTHIDKTFTAGRLGRVKPGLLGAIDAMMQDKLGWTPEDVRLRASKALAWAYEAGVVRLRTHVDWWDPQKVPIA